MDFDSGRIVLAAEPSPARQAEFEVAAIGHTDAEADLTVLFANKDIIGTLETLGYRALLASLRAAWQGGQASDALYDLPIPVNSLAQYNALFSKPMTAPEQTPYASQIAGAAKWLPKAVADFFMEPGAARKTLWVVSVNPNHGQQAFYADSTPDLLNLTQANAFSRLLALPTLGLIILPDLERLQIPSGLAAIPRLQIPNPVPAFLPCATNLDDGIRERNGADEQINYPDPDAFKAAVSQMLVTLKRYRPDLRVMLTMPYDDSLAGELPQLSEAAVAELAELKQSPLGDGLHRLQLVYPYLMDATQRLHSACGLLAGQIAKTAQQQGAWRSIAGKPLPGDYEPWPNLPQAQIAHYRNHVGLGVLTLKVNRLQLDDERLSAGVFSAAGDALAADASGEISRFMGWLYRALENLGRDLVFEVQSRSRQALVVLNDFFTQLYQAGALRGATPEAAYRIESEADVDHGQLIFTIAIAPAFPIDTLRITLQPDRVVLAYD